MLDPIIRTIEVPCNQERAFTIFINEMDSWWPLGKFTTTAFTGKAAASIRVDAKEGGEIIEVSPDGTEYKWGTIKNFEPYDFISMNFHIPHPEDDIKNRSLVEVRFTVLSENQTRVELKQSNWEAFGKLAKDLQGGYGKGWTIIFESAYKAACGG
jgi:uncharacterized protein YndB with AHSA1/START domain